MTSKTCKLELNLTEPQLELLLDSLLLCVRENIQWGGNEDVKKARELKNYVLEKIGNAYGFYQERYDSSSIKCGWPDNA